MNRRFTLPDSDRLHKNSIKSGSFTQDNCFTSLTSNSSIRPKDVKVRLEALVNIICNDPNGPVRLLKVTAYK